MTRAVGAGVQRGRSRTPAGLRIERVWTTEADDGVRAGDVVGVDGALRKK